MTQPQPGWYPDPADPDRQRYWAGDAWTAETRQLDEIPDEVGKPLPSAVPHHAAADPFASYTAVQPSGPMPVYRGPAAVPQSNARGPRTADGVPLAGWWWRVLAWLIDWLILMVVSVLYGGLLPDYSKGFAAWQNDYWQAFRAGSTSVPLPFDAQYAVASPMAITEAASLAVACLYVIITLRFGGATLGQMALGLRVVPAGKGLAPRGLAMSHVLRRMLGWNILPAALMITGILLIGSGAANRPVGMLCLFGGSLYQILSALWASWDPKRQGLHDKIAGTQVIRPER